eukprot:scaffold49278_cov75-Phaeocystis_antarctica.AAC.1
MSTSCPSGTPWWRETITCACTCTYAHSSARRGVVVTLDVLSCECRVSSVLFDTLFYIVSRSGWDATPRRELRPHREPQFFSLARGACRAACSSVECWDRASSSLTYPPFLLEGVALQDDLLLPSLLAYLLCPTDVGSRAAQSCRPIFRSYSGWHQTLPVLDWRVVEATDDWRSGWTRGSSPRSIYSGPRGLSESKPSGINLQSHRREKDTSVPWSACTRGKTAEPALGRLRTTKSSVSRTSASTARSRKGDHRRRETSPSSRPADCGTSRTSTGASRAPPSAPQRP